MYVIEKGAGGILKRVASQGMAQLCYTCGICVGDCPAARFSDDFNPKQIFLKVGLGIANGLIEQGSPIWKCTTCYTCAERCPAGVKPVEVIIALRNLSFSKGLAPEQVDQVRQAVINLGIVSTMTDTVLKRRQEMGLPQVDAKLGDVVKGIVGEGHKDKL